MDNNCDHLKDFLKSQKKIITRHIDEHKWFTHIKDDNQAMIDFIKKYGWLMREIYCENACPHENCEAFKSTIDKFK